MTLNDWHKYATNEFFGFRKSLLLIGLGIHESTAGGTKYVDTHDFAVDCWHLTALDWVSVMPRPLPKDELTVLDGDPSANKCSLVLALGGTMTKKFKQPVSTIEPTDSSKAGPGAISGNGQDGSEAPDWLFDLIDRHLEELTGHRFEMDAAASSWNAMCPRFFDENVDSLRQDWSSFRCIWCNPPHSAKIVERFAAKAIEAAERGLTVVLLLPIWPGFDWYQGLKRRGQMRDVIGPVRFRNYDGRPVVLNNGRYSYSLVVAFLGPHFAPFTNGPPIRRMSEADKDEMTLCYVLKRDEAKSKTEAIEELSIDFGHSFSTIREALSGDTGCP